MGGRMYLEFKDSFHYVNGHFERWNNAVDILNDYIEQNTNGRNEVEIISYRVVYLPDKQTTQTCILAHFIEVVKR